MNRTAEESLSRWEHEAAREVVHRVRLRVAPELIRVLLFGSVARGEARPDSDLDLLLIFDRLPPDREPYATQAEWIAGDVARESGVPVTVWSVSRVDLELGNRTPMLVDALDDGIPLWPAGAWAPRIAFTPADALHCAGALLERINEGSVEVAHHLRAGDRRAAARRGRDDIVRLCTAFLLLAGQTRPRRGDAVRSAAVYWPVEGSANGLGPILDWAAESFGPDGHNEECPVGPPPGGYRALAAAVQVLWARIAERGLR